ncbi:MAG: AMMECR1 domain-containing protein [Bacteroidales bacterium]
MPRWASSELPTFHRDLRVESARALSDPLAFELGRHGIYIKSGTGTGTFLPQVADQTGWTKEEFLGHCARDKAGIGWEGWKNAEVYRYEAIVFGEEKKAIQMP